MKVSSAMPEEARKKAAVASTMPAGGAPSTSEVKKPRRWTGTYSATIVVASESSAPAPKPCRNRKITSRIGASTPTAAAVGSRPMATVAIAMSTIVRIIAGRRPCRSPM